MHDTILMESLAQTGVGKPLFEFSYVPMPDSLLVASSLERAVSPSEIFSSSSVLNAELAVESGDIAMIAHSFVAWQVSVFLLFVLFYYSFVVYRFQGPMLSTLFRVALSTKKTIKAYEVKSNEQNSLTFHGTLLSILMFSCYAIAYTHVTVNAYPLVMLSAAVLISILFCIYKYLIIVIAQYFSDSKVFFASLEAINRHTITLWGVLIAPVAVASAIVNTDSHMAIWIYLCLWICYIWKIFKLFVSNGFGGLQWILYLCTVELLPVSFLVALVVKYSEL